MSSKTKMEKRSILESNSKRGKMEILDLIHEVFYELEKARLDQDEDKIETKEKELNLLREKLMQRYMERGTASVLSR
jgi:hypothetical protein